MEELNVLSDDLQDLLVWIKYVTGIDIDEIMTLIYCHEYDANPTVDTIMKHSTETKINGVDEKSTIFNALYGHIQREIPLAFGILALNIPEVNAAIADKLAKYPSAIKSLMTLNSTIYRDEFWSGMKDIVGETAEASIKENCTKFSRLLYIKDRLLWKENEHGEIN